MVAHVFGALGEAWSDLADSVPRVLDEDAAVPLLGAALETLAGPGCLVFDDAHLASRRVLEAILHTTIAALPAGCRLVLCTRGSVPAEVLRVEAMGRARTLGPAELAFDEDECRRVGAAAGIDADLFDRTGGWPLAVGLLLRADRPSLERHRLGTDRKPALAQLALSDLPLGSRDLMTVLARLPCFPTGLHSRLGGRFAAIERFGREHPTLLGMHNAWWSPREWLREALSEVAADQSIVTDVVEALTAVDEVELAAQLLLAEARHEEAVPLIEGLATQGLQQGRPAWVSSLVGSVPSRARTFTLDLCIASAAERLSAGAAASESTLRALVDRAVHEGSGPLLRAQAVLASHYRMQADIRLFAVCEEALTDVLTERHARAGHRRAVVGRRSCGRGRDAAVVWARASLQSGTRNH